MPLEAIIRITVYEIFICVLVVSLCCDLSKTMESWNEGKRLRCEYEYTVTLSPEEFIIQR
jgi:hypothetical protein